jgi:hypothetical protein
MARALDDYIDDVLPGVIDRGPRGRFSTEDVRNAINDKHSLHLLPDDDGEIGRALHRRPDIRLLSFSARPGEALWEPGRVPKNTAQELPGRR